MSLGIGRKFLASLLCLSFLQVNQVYGASGLPAGVGVSDPTLSLNLSGVSDYSTENPFLDISHTMRPWIGHQGGTWSAMTYEQLQAGGFLDADGWPTKIPTELTSIGTIWDWGSSDTDPLAAASRAGVYVLTYEGEGTVQMTLGAHVLSASPGRIVFEDPTGSTMGFNITATDPNGTGNYIHDISVVPQKYEALAQTGELFNPDWLPVVNDARELRFMDWMGTNGSSLTNWADRPQVGDASWAVNGVPLEVMVQLANQTGTDPWFTMPAQASDDYIRQFATYVHDHLNPDLVAHVEYSNETWNWAFPQTHWLADQAQAEWGVTGGTSWINYAAKRATETALIWDQVFGSEAHTRVDNVLGVQTANSWLANEELTAPVWAAHDPNYVAPSSVFNSLAITTYFGGATVTDATLRDQLLAVLKDPNIDANAWLAAKLTDPTYSQSIPQIAAWWAGMKTVADQYGLNVIAYEGGQHVQQSFAVSGLTDADLATLNTFFTNFVRSPQMADLYNQLWDAWKQVSDGPFMQFGDVAEPSQYGSWALLRALGDTNPRAALLSALNADQHSWFGDGGGTRYQQGVIQIAGNAGETLTGTQKDDFLVGGDGNDTFIPGAGHDVINGGKGDDTIMVSGDPSEYRYRWKMRTCLLVGSSTELSFSDVEVLSFKNGVMFKVPRPLNQKTCQQLNS